ncbi:MAG: class I SAM-dependent methyltransferase [Thermomicrobiales bacterium]
MATQVIDSAKAEAFGGRMVGLLNEGFLGLLIGVGHQTGLFDTLADLPASTSEQIASATGLHERYVREWLGGMAVGRIVDYDTDARTYRLPPEHAAVLTRAAGPDNLAFFTQYLALAGGVEQGVVAAFRHGGGVPYAAFDRMQQLLAEESAPLYDTVLVATILPLATGLVERLHTGIAVLDIGCGQGHAVNVMARAFPNSRFTGYDLADESVAAARAEAARLGLENAHFAAQDVATLGESARYDLITAFDVIHDLARPLETLQGIARALRPGGIFLMMEIAASSDLADNLDHPFGPFLYGISAFYCMTVSLAQDGPGLGTVWGHQSARRTLAEAGFAAVEMHQLPGDFFHSFFIAHRD